jgi:hypothetical protein
VTKKKKKGITRWEWHYQPLNVGCMTMGREHAGAYEEGTLKWLFANEKELPYTL